MAKQTFTTGQVLTAAQMTSLQQTAMLGGAASAKTASYTLVAADAGTAISMSNASATTITVNTALFAAGDTVQITNIGAGTCTITAGTATVNTSASLALAQYESGTLDFTSTSAAIFIKGAGAAASGGSNYSLLNSGGTAMSGSSTVTVSGISGQNKLFVVMDAASSVSSAISIFFRINADSGATQYAYYGNAMKAATAYSGGNFVGRNSSGTSRIFVLEQSNDATNDFGAGISVDGCNATGYKIITLNSGPGGTGVNQESYNLQGYYKGTSTVSSISIIAQTGNFDAGTLYVYGSA